MKEVLRSILEKYRLNEIAERAPGKRRILNALTALTYDTDPLIAWRAVEAIGVAADAIADADPGRVTGHLRQLHWLLSDESGGVCWYAPQAMAEIVRRRPQLFSDYIPLIVSLLVTMEKEDIEHFRPGILWAIGRLAPVAGDAIEEVLPAVEACLEDPDAQVRGMAVWCFVQAGKRDRLADRKDLKNDDGSVMLYSNGSLDATTVRRLLNEAPMR